MRVKSILAGSLVCTLLFAQTTFAAAENKQPDTAASAASATESFSAESAAAESFSTESSAAELSVTESSAAESAAAESFSTESPATESSAAETAVPETTAEGSSAVEASADMSARAKPAEYLREYFNVEFAEGSDVTVDEFNKALVSMGGEMIEADTLTMADAVKATICLGGMEELALTYIKEDDPDKAARCLSEKGVTVDEEYVPYVACALDLGLDAGFDFSGPVSAEEAAALLYKGAELGGQARRYIGFTKDYDIIARLYTEMDSFTLFDDDNELSILGRNIVLSGATTGYSLKYINADARFLDEYTLLYSHSEKKHLAQLVALLKSEGIDAYVQVEPKVSVYEYMQDWGDPGEPTPTYAVREVGEGRYLTYALEYDLMLEFNTPEEKEAFHQIIETYAKKYDDSVDEDGNVTEKLLYESFWQPLYSSHTEMENEEYVALVDNVIYSSDGNYSIHSYSLPEAAEDVAAVVTEKAPDLVCNPVTVYTNPAFYRYMTGEDYQ